MESPSWSANLFPVCRSRRGPLRPSWVRPKRRAPARRRWRGARALAGATARRTSSGSTRGCPGRPCRDASRTVNRPLSGWRAASLLTGR